MPRDGAYLLSDWPAKVGFACDHCGIEKRYDRDDLIARLGDVRMTDLLDDMAVALGCLSQKPGLALYEQCQARFTTKP